MSRKDIGEFMNENEEILNILFKKILSEKLNSLKDITQYILKFPFLQNKIVFIFM